MRAQNLSALLFVTTCLSACVAVPQKTAVSTAFDPKTAAYAKLSGSGKLEGQAFLRQVGGTVVTGAGEQVILLPAVPYTEEIVAKKGRVTNIDPEIKPYIKTAQADASGNFYFERLSAGDYFVVTKVQWGVPTRYGIDNQGGEMTKRVKVAGSGTTKVLLTEVE